jgi:hypothetical protein
MVKGDPLGALHIILGIFAFDEFWSKGTLFEACSTHLEENCLHEEMHVVFTDNKILFDIVINHHSLSSFYCGDIMLALTNLYQSHAPKCVFSDKFWN